MRAFKFKNVSYANNICGRCRIHGNMYQRKKLYHEDISVLISFNNIRSLISNVKGCLNRLFVLLRQYIDEGRRDGKFDNLDSIIS